MTINNDWKQILSEEFKKEYFIKLKTFLDIEYEQNEIFPKKENVFEVFKLTEYKNVKVVILGQDPYHGENQAHGLAFSVQKGIKTPPSLLNIYKELNQEFGYDIPNNGYLNKWAKQGVFLMNAVFTVRAHEPNSHKNKGWETFTDNIIKILNEKETPIVFVLWGANARKKSKLIDQSKHYILESVHPSPLSAYRGFFGNNHFTKINYFLKENNETSIDWQIENID